MTYAHVVIAVWAVVKLFLRAYNLVPAVNRQRGHRRVDSQICIIINYRCEESLHPREQP